MLVAIIILVFWIAVACIIGGVGVLCTQGGRSPFVGMILGLPTLSLALVIFTFCSGGSLIGLGVVAIIPVLLGSFTVWQGIQTGKRNKDIFAAVTVVLCVAVVGFLLTEYPTVEKIILRQLLFHMTFH